MSDKKPSPSLWAYEQALELWVEAHSRSSWVESRERMAKLLDQIVTLRLAEVGASPKPADEEQSEVV